MKYVNKDKKCYFDQNSIKEIDYKNVTQLLKFVDYFWRLKKSYYTWTSRKMQQKLSQAVKRARLMALISFVR